MVYPQYCKYCKWYISKWMYGKGDQRVTKDEKVCGASIHTYVDETGELLIRTYGNDKTCEECGTILEKANDIRYKRCIDKNKDLKCKDFDPKRRYFYIRFVPTADPRKMKKHASKK